MDKLCNKIDTCQKIDIIKDKDMLDFQFVKSVRAVCAECSDYESSDVNVDKELMGECLLTEDEVVAEASKDSTYCELSVKMGLWTSEQTALRAIPIIRKAVEAERLDRPDRGKIIDLLHWTEYRFIGQGNATFEGVLTQESEEQIADKLLALYPDAEESLDNIRIQIAELSKKLNDREADLINAKAEERKAVAEEIKGIISDWDEMGKIADGGDTWRIKYGCYFKPYKVSYIEELLQVIRQVLNKLGSPSGKDTEEE